MQITNTLVHIFKYVVVSDVCYRVMMSCMSVHQPPPLRLLLLGPRGAGKSLHARYLAKKLGLFHIQFHERLQELVMGKTKGKKVLQEHEIEEDEEFPPEEE